MVTPIFLDTEFLDDGQRFEAISIALVATDGAEYYAISADCDIDAVMKDPWLRAHVVPHLPLHTNTRGWAWDPAHPDHAHIKARTQIAIEIHAFIAGYSEPELWAYFSPYDHVILTQLYGRFSDLPAPIPPFTRDLMQEAKRSGIPIPNQQQDVHHALADARHNRDVANTIWLQQPESSAGSKSR